MRRPRARTFAALAARILPTLAMAVTLVGAPLAAQDREVFDAAYAAWDRGDYVVALEGLERLLASPGGAALLADVAVLTGERYRTIEVAPDGTNPRWSPDGRHAAYDLPGDAPRTVVVAVRDGSVRAVAELAGRGAVFSPDGSRVAWLRTADPEALAREEDEVRSRIEVRTRADWERRNEELAAARARHARVRVLDLGSGAERDVPASEPVHAVVWRDGKAVPWVAGPDVRLSPTGAHLVYAHDDGLGLLAIGSGWQRTFPGSDSPAFSADGSTLVFLSRDEEARYALRRVLLDGPGADTRLPERLLTATDALANPAASADGSRVAFQRMGRENWEVWITGPDDDEPRRLTHDVQHDLFPAFLAGDRLLVIKGEGRHRRSYVYPVMPAGDPAVRAWVPGLGEGMRLFHNNTVRTVAPEYEWAVSPDGTMILIGAERDGDTISPERGVYLTDLGRPTTLEEVRARVADQLAGERALRERGRRTFDPVADEVRAAVDDVSVSRIYRYQADLFRFGSKFITQPGNALAIDYLVETLRGFGYEPELQWLPSATSAPLRFEPRPGLRSANVIARIPGVVHPDVVYVVSSHFDSVERGPGADDNTSGTAALLEAARVLAERPQGATIEFAFFTAEEAGLLGSREFARRAIEEGKDVVGALNNDMIGYANDHRLDNTIRYSNAGIRDLQHAAAFLFTDLILHDAHYYKSTDAHALYDAFGDVIGGIGSYPILANPHYHQEHDVLETINHRLVAEVSKTTVASILRMAAGPSRVAGVEIRRGGAGEAGGVELAWDPAVERDVSSWVVVYGPEDDPFRHRVEAREPRVRLPDAEAGWRFGVKAVSWAGLDSWDWAWAQ